MLKSALILSFILFITHLKASIVILNGLTHIHKTDKGQIYTGKIEIQNTGLQSKTIKLYLQDLSYHYDGSIQYSPLSAKIKSNAKWIKLNNNLVNLNAKETTEVFYEITVPDSITVEGSYWSTIIVEPVEEINPNSKNTGVQITSIVRYAIQIISNYTITDLKPQLKFEKIEIEKNKEGQILKIAISNTGRIYCKTTVSVDIYDNKDGQKISNKISQSMGLLPDNSKLFPIDLTGLPPGKYKAVVFASDTEENTFAVNIDLEI